MQARAEGPAAKKLWGGRFTGATDPLMEKFNESLPFDRRMWAEDIRGSQAYAKALAKAGVLTEEESATIVDGLSSVASEWEAGTFEVKQGDEARWAASCTPGAAATTRWPRTRGCGWRARSGACARTCRR